MAQWPTGISPHGRGIRIRIWHNRREYTETVQGSIHAKSDITSAVKRRDWLKSRLTLGLSINIAEHGSNPTFIEAAQEYLNALSAEYSTHISYENIINNVWLPEFSQHQLNDITSRQIRNTLNQQNRSKKTRLNYLIPLRGIFDHHDITPNPAKIKAGGKEQKTPIKRFTPAERQLILAQLQGQHLVYFAILFGTGMRPGEIIALHWSDYKNQQLSVDKSIVRRRHKHSTKTHKARKVYVPEWARNIIEQHPTRFNGGPILTNTQGSPHLDTEQFNKAWR
ncbi:MAG: tyrosine-type recombinase/integrase, partial [Alphaproteobacteria bacterium]